MNFHPWASAPSTWHRKHLVGAALVGLLLLAYCQVLSASMRRVESAQAAQASMLQARMACERLPLAHARGACAVAALRGDGAAAPLQLLLP
jgi:hypothetical protein